MPDPLELQRLKVNLSRIHTAKMELELKICERKEEMERIKDHIKLQNEQEEKTLKEIKELEEKTNG